MTASARVQRTRPRAAASPAQRSTVRAVAMPTEHGGWGLTLEPGILGLLVEPSLAGLLLAVTAVVAFMARTPLKLVLVDRWRGRWLPRTRVAAYVAAVELAVLAALVVGAVVLADRPFWVPFAIAAPFVAVELWFDMRSKSRRLAPELAGAVGVCSFASAIALAGGADARLAAALWLVPAGRVVSSIPFVRAQIARLHGRPTNPRALVASDVTCLALAATAVALEPAVVGGPVLIVAAVAYQRISAQRPVPRPAVLGMRQMLLGLAVVAATAISVHVG